MWHVVGFSNPDQLYLWPLISEHRFCFDTDDFVTMGYFDLIGPCFNKFSLRDSGTEVLPFGVLFALKDDDLNECVDILSRLHAELSQRPRSWSVYLGTYSATRKPTVRIEPTLFRRKAQFIVHHLIGMANIAKHEKLHLVYGNGVSFRHLCGIPLPPSTEEYS